MRASEPPASPPFAPRPPVHLTVDVEEFFHSTLLVERIPAHTWDDYPRRAGLVVPWMLDELARAGSRATFFVLGWSAERDPALVKRIADAGHEVAAHSWVHRRVDALTPAAFREATHRTKALLEDLTGEPVTGYRAPSFSISPGCEWAFDVLLELGFRYDSSLFPVDHGPGYGYAGTRVEPHPLEREAGVLWEVPPLTLTLGARRLPAAGGGYLRLLPFLWVRSALVQAARQGLPATLYVHPWDLDPDVERPRLPPLLRHRLFAGAAKARRRFSALVAEHPSVNVRDTLATLAPRDPAASP